ncbi:O-antigen ligase family protein [Paraclostridium sordellii]|uniref:O-antigen ligase family protein n=1 Tax=Paraclostridium sordellii TaxID=1505 RepID=UPI0005E24576|nr:O-antigen ligase family protein [Paeniclostridium sordellii]CEP81820.1 Lipid A core-O-antigen ligase and related enzymes [[Clostridium] sordellii] [Paeniclostridium sordellii]
MIINKVKKSSNQENLEMIVIIFYNVLMLFYQMIGTSISTCLGIVFFTWFISRKTGPWNIIQKLTFLICIYVPTSFVSIIGTSYGNLPITWFNISIMIICILIIYNGFYNGFYLQSVLLMISFGLLSFFLNQSIIDAAKQLINIVLFVLSFFIGENVSKWAHKKFILKLKKYYIVSVFSFSTIVVIQFICNEYLNIKVGYQDVIGVNRVVFGGLMNDYSFATLYIATGSMLIFIEYIDNKSINIIKFIGFEIYFMIGMLIANSRTGLFALIVVAGIYLLVKTFGGKWESIIIILVIILIIPYVFKYIVESRGGQTLLESSGRTDLIKFAMEIFYDNPLFGLGLGSNKWMEYTGKVLPHNLIAQYLAQMGIIGSFIFYSNFVVLINKYLKYGSEFWWVIVVILVGAMAIPDIVSSRFLSVLVIIIILSSISNKKEILEGEIYEKSREVIVKKY